MMHRKDMFRNENYRTGLGLTPAQRDFHVEWVRAKPIYFGEVARPWGSLALVPREPSRREWAEGMRPVDLSANRYVPIEDVLALLMVGRGFKAPPGKTCMTFRLQEVAFGLDEGGHMQAGGSARKIVSEVDFAKTPLQVTQMYDPCWVPPGTEWYDLYCYRAGRLTLQHSEQWVDICLGCIRGSRVPQVIFRIWRPDFEEGQVELLVKEGELVLADTLIAYAHADATIGIARFNEYREAEICLISDDRLYCNPIGTAQRNTDRILATANVMNRLANDMVFDNTDNRPPIIPIEDWAPSCMIEVPAAELAEIWHHPKYRHTATLKGTALHGVGPDGDFYAVSEHSGVFTEVVYPARRPHLMQLHVGGKVQSLPVSAILMDGIEPGVTLQAGQQLAEACPRGYYAGWENLAERMDVTRDGQPSDYSNSEWWLLRQVFNRLVRKTGEEGWQGQGCLLDYRLLPTEVVKPHWRRYLDLGSVQQFAEPDLGSIVCPPFYEDGSGTEFTANGITYSWATRAELNGIAEPRFTAVPETV